VRRGLPAAPQHVDRIGVVEERSETTIAFGPVGLTGIALLVLGILLRRRLVALFGFAGVVADVTIPELGGFKAFNEPRAAGRAEDAGLAS